MYANGSATMKTKHPAITQLKRAAFGDVAVVEKHGMGESENIHIEHEKRLKVI
jgi:hypothetical protein